MSEYRNSRGYHGFDPNQPRTSDGKFSQKHVTEAAGGVSALEVDDEIRRYNSGWTIDNPPTAYSAAQIYDFWATVRGGERPLWDDFSGLDADAMQQEVRVITVGRVDDFRPRIPQSKAETEACIRVGHMLNQIDNFSETEKNKLRDFEIYVGPNHRARVGDLADRYDCGVMTFAQIGVRELFRDRELYPTTGDFVSKCSDVRQRVMKHAHHLEWRYETMPKSDKKRIERWAAREIDYDLPYDHTKNIETIGCRIGLELHRERMKEQYAVARARGRALRADYLAQKREKRARWDWLLGESKRNYDD